MNGSNGSGNGHGHGASASDRESHKRHAADDGGRKKRIKRSSGKACVYCRRRWVVTGVKALTYSHMVCEGGRPCERWYVSRQSQSYSHLTHLTY